MEIKQLKKKFRNNLIFKVARILVNSIKSKKIKSKKIMKTLFNYLIVKWAVIKDKL